MHPSIKVTFENPEIIYENEKKVQVWDFLDVKIILHEDNSVETDIYYKLTNTHDYVPYDSAHLDHTQVNIPHNLAERTIVFISNPEKVIIRLVELSKSIFNAKLQGPAPNPEKGKNVVPFFNLLPSYRQQKLNVNGEKQV